MILILMPMNSEQFSVCHRHERLVSEMVKMRFVMIG